MDLAEIVLEPERRAAADGDDERTLSLVLGGFAFFQAVATACQIDLFGHLSRNSGMTTAEISADLELPLQSTRILLLACTSLGLLHRDPKTGGYANARLAERSFVRGSRGDLFPLLDAYSKLHYPAFTHTLEAIRTGTNSGLACFPGSGDTIYERIAQYPELEQVFHDWMRCLNGFGQSWLQVPELSRATHVIDAGGGTGPNALLLSQLYPGVRVTIFDLPSICQVVDEKRKRWGPAASNISTHAGDFRTDPFPEGADVIAFLRIFNIYSPQSNRELLTRCYAYLPSGGCVIASSMLADDDETGSLTAAHLSLYFHVLATGKGMVYPLSDYVSWFEAAGFEALSVYRMGGDRILVGKKA
jgi:ubiquinone/menaquinone biosynthesis C-methylase UbiE